MKTMKGLPSDLNAKLSSNCYIVRAERQNEHSQYGRYQAYQYDCLKCRFSQLERVGLQPPNNAQCNQQTYHGAGSVCSSLETKRQAALFLLNRVCNQGVARRSTDALTQAVSPAHSSNLPPTAGYIKEGLGER
jgi:hypothetical protein